VSEKNNTPNHIGVFVAWPYANGDLHLGHVAGAYLPADIFARYNRLRGKNVLMVSGSDAHGTPITLKAKEENTTPIDIVYRYHEKFLEGWQRLGISFDLFTHTHTANHQEIAKEVFLKLKEKGDLETKVQPQFFDEEQQMFLPDRYVTGTCPFCKYERARGDQCEDCGKTYETKELLNPVSKLSDSTPVLKDTEHYFFKLGNYQKQALDYLESKTDWRPHVKNFTEAMVREGLQSRAITRDIDWGVSVPVDGWESKVLYVWFDAVIGYLSASKEWASLSGQENAWEKWWKGNDSASYYFIGKDNIPFHTVIWPIELMAYDDTLNLPTDVPANQFLNIDGEKFSTSRGLAVWLLDVLERLDADAVRFYLTSIAPETKDANFSWDEMITRNNGELVAAWGNLVNRVLGFAYSRFDAKVPDPQELDEIDKTLLASIEKGMTEVAELYEKVQLRDALKQTLTLTREVNKYLDVKAPWKLFKTDPEAAGTVVFVAMKVIDSLKILYAPVLPHSSQKIHEFFGHENKLFGDNLKESQDGYSVLRYEEPGSNEDVWKMSTLSSGSEFQKPTHLFKVLDETSVE